MCTRCFKNLTVHLILGCDSRAIFLKGNILLTYVLKLFPSLPQVTPKKDIRCSRIPSPLHFSTPRTCGFLYLYGDKYTTFYNKYNTVF